MPPALTTILIDTSPALEDDVADELLCDDFELDVCAADEAEEDVIDADESVEETTLETDTLEADVLVEGVVSLTPPPQADNRATNAKHQMLLWPTVCL